MKISSLYHKIVPTYLKEDHPVGIPKEASALIQLMRTQGAGEGVPADALDNELSAIFRNKVSVR